MKTDEPVRSWLCDCGRIHIESKQQRQNFMPPEFLDLLSIAATMGGASTSIAQATHQFPTVCYNEAAKRAAHFLTAGQLGASGYLRKGALLCFVRSPLSGFQMRSALRTPRTAMSLPASSNYITHAFDSAANQRLNLETRQPYLEEL
jgi:hypothetical protein